MHPHIEFSHILNELSVNRNDPCEVIREIISNAYDAAASKILYAPLEEESGFLFFDNGVGLSSDEAINGVTPYEAFFSIGKSTKKKGESIGYKCQGAKLCFAATRILVITRSAKEADWRAIRIENPRQVLNVSYDITPEHTQEPWNVLRSFFATTSSSTASVLSEFGADFFKKSFKTGTLIVIHGLDTENYSKSFLSGDQPEGSYIYNYIRFSTRHGDVRSIDESQGFNANHTLQVKLRDIRQASLKIFSNQAWFDVPFGFPYLEKPTTITDIKSPAQIARLRDGRFFARGAKSFTLGSGKYSIVFAIDGNRRAHEDYIHLDRKGSARSGVRLADQRGVFIAVNGIKVCRYSDIFKSPVLESYMILGEKDNSSHYTMIINGEFDLVTNRNSLSGKSYGILASNDFTQQIQKFLDYFKNNDPAFNELLSRLKKESTESKLTEQIDDLKQSKSQIKSRERLRITHSSGESPSEEIFMCPIPGEEYLVGVLYANLYNFVPKDHPLKKFWKKVLTFSTQGIDSLGLKDLESDAPLKEQNLISIEYKYSFDNSGPFNHALAIVDYIVAWNVNLQDGEKVKDEYSCFGTVSRDPEFGWSISDIENDEGGSYQQKRVHVISLRELIEKSLTVKFHRP